MTRDLVIVGAGAFSVEIASAVDAINMHSAGAPPWRLLGFLDDAPALQGQLVADAPVLGPIEASVDDGRCYVGGIASYRNREARRQIVERLNLPERRWASIIHPAAHLSRLTSIGCGSVVLQGACVESRAKVGRHVLISPLSIVSHDVELGDFSTVAQRATVCGSARIGPGAYIGAGAIVRDGLRVGEGSLVGIGAVALRDVAAGTTVLGNPAKPLQRGARRSR